jgi:hypothetical protein
MLPQGARSRLRLVRRGGTLLFLLSTVFGLTPGAHQLPAQAPSTEGLYGKTGVKPEAVRQGRLGSCYFHAVIAALAQANSEKVRSMIQPNSDGTYAVQFADGKKENAYPEDIRYSRESGYDLSEGLWVAVLFRAYAQRVLRESLAAAVDRTDLFALVKRYAQDVIASNDPVLLAYDRAIRAVVDQHGKIDRTKLEARLKEQMGPIRVPDDVKSSLISMMDSGGFFASLETMIQQNGEIFGAYRAVGQGGLAERVMAAFAGSESMVENESESQAAAVLNQGMSAQRPMVACTGGSQYYKLRAQNQALPSDTASWYINAHCYTVLAYDPASQIVKLRNPWADQPYPDGILNLPMSRFVPAYLGIVSTGE